MNVVITFGSVDTRTGSCDALCISSKCRRASEIIFGEAGKSHPYPSMTVDFEDLQKIVNCMAKELERIGEIAICGECGKEK